MSDVKKRVVWIDTLRGIAMCMVVLSHSRVAPCVIANFCWCCHVPLFFIISGIVLGINQSEKLTLADFLKNKARGILYPYVTLSIIELIMEYFTNRTGIKSSFIAFVSLDGIGVLWFLPTLFFSSVLWYFVKKIKNIICVLAIAIAIAVAMSLYAVPNVPYAFTYILTRCIYATIFMLIGNILYNHLETIQRYTRLVIIIGVLAYIYGNYYFSYYSFDLHYAQIMKPLSYWFITLGTSLLWITIVSQLNKNVINEALSFIGRNTLIVLEGHWLLLQLLVNPYMKMLPIEKNIFELLNCVVMFIILIPIIKIINKRAMWIIKPVYQKNDL